MAEKLTAEEKLDLNIGKIKDKVIRECLKVCAKTRKYPKDCITDGSLDLMVKGILHLEEAAAKYEVSKELLE